MSVHELSDKDLVAVTYISHSLIKPSEVESECNNIEAISSRNNAPQEISGILLFCRNRFIQRLEGKRDVIDKTIERIKQDKRHRKFTLVRYESINQRYFNDWSHMKVLSAGKGFDELEQLFASIESGHRTVSDDIDSRFILNFIQHYKDE
ncbi:BLUF domain-containing protein [Alteromonas sp. S005]|uniref:BLUF domain-containing protein n=1 Tax=Alteromonas sp. S005 TaxID=3117400 RepID=UPI002FDF9463